MLAVTNLASEMIAAASSRPSFLIFQFLSSILDIRSDVILSLRDRRKETHEKRERNQVPYHSCINGVKFKTFSGLLRFFITSSEFSQQDEHLPVIVFSRNVHN